MEIKELLKVMHMAEKLKEAVRHCYTSGGRRESVAEHSWRISLLAYFIKDEYPGVDMEKVIKMCLIHDLGEAFTGDIPAFKKTEADSEREKQLLFAWVDSLPQPFAQEMRELYTEMEVLETEEAKIYKALDKVEAIIQHNESDISTWAENEYDLNLTYGVEQAAFSPFLKSFREAVREETLEKMEKADCGHP